MTTHSSLSETVSVMQQHRSFRNFTADPIPAEHLEAIIRAGQGAASSNFVQAYSIIRILNPDTKEKISVLANNQAQIKECAVFLLFCADLKRAEYACRKHGEYMAYDTMENLLVSVIDTALVAQNVLTAAESLGYGGCYIGGVRNHPQEIGDIVGLPDKVFPLFGMTLGVPVEEQEVKPRLPVEAVLHEERYEENRYGTLLEEYDRTLQAYYAARSRNQKTSTWTSEMAAFFAQDRRLHMQEFLRRKGFGKR
jgi:FMN reductase (NADPH)